MDRPEDALIEIAQLDVMSRWNATKRIEGHRCADVLHGWSAGFVSAVEAFSILSVDASAVADLRSIHRHLLLAAMSEDVGIAPDDLERQLRSLADDQ